MQFLRKLHLLLGCVFAPLLIYFALSGAWQVAGWQDQDKNNPTGPKHIFHELSAPHVHQSFPGADRKSSHSTLFSYFSIAMAFGFCTTAISGIAMAYRFFKPVWVVTVLLLLGIVLPLLFLFLSAHH